MSKKEVSVKKSAIFLMTALLALLFVISYASTALLGSEENTSGESRINQEESLELEKSVETVKGPKTVKVVLERRYLDGQISEETIEETIWAQEDFWAHYSGWSLKDQNNERIVFTQDIEDISPLLKWSGYFGLDENGVLTIFKGRPEGNEVIQSFYQIDTERLESHYLEQLGEGIPVKTKETYESVLKVLEEAKAEQM
ncbi:BofC C-terminal domain-containing protein [Thalassobacillus sp. C254]|uniref:BofC C-terminal domain-containing protein n=1 Tax=Thalassobacillus sp. C254 TaxID=1225341 RepID=UPI0006D1CD09|nr:BofC C-terminal domain-containing protein [Thalassobacillus sp. C254]